MKKILVSILAVGLAMTGLAQEKLQKEITLDKDFVPVVKKVTKKSSLPQVLKTTTSENSGNSSINYSSWVKPANTTPSIPTMLPYGYRTSHVFSSDQLGYVDLGAGTQLNIVGSAGYRFLNTDSVKAGLWLQHSSTWSGKNSATLAEGFQPLKQKYNDNTIGADVESRFAAGVLNVGVKVNFDNFNYYGAQVVTSDLALGNQNFLNANLSANWKGMVNLSHYQNIAYHVDFNYNYAGYNKDLSAYVGAAKEHYIQAMVGGKYGLSPCADLGLDVKFDFLNHKTGSTSKNMEMITLAPQITYRGDNLCARLGADMNFSFNDGTTFRIAPNVELSYDFIPGATMFANAKGGKVLNTLSRMAVLTRYSDPSGNLVNSFTPVDAEFGFKIGPFQGFTAKIYGGYGIFKNQLFAYSKDAELDAKYSRYVAYCSYNTKGLKVGADVNYKYRSLAEITLKGVYAPQDKEFKEDETTGYSLGLDNAKWIANVDVKVYPIKPLSVNVGIDMRGGRRQLAQSVGSELFYYYTDMDNVMNLYAGAAYRFDSKLTFWVKANNLLNKQWNLFDGMGAQKLSVMGGIGYVF